jgi:hypothetical protein
MTGFASFPGDKLFGGDDHHDLAAFKARIGFNFGDFGCIGLDPVEEPVSQLLMGHFATPETQRHFDLVALFEEALDGLHFDVIVMIVNHRAHLYLFDFNDFLLLAGFGGLLLLLEFELAIIQDLGHRRHCVGRDFDQIEIGLLGHCEGLTGGNDPNILSIGSDEAHLARVDTVVYPVAFFFLRGGGTAGKCWPPGGYAQVCQFSMLGSVPAFESGVDGLGGEL